jgi:hypothetical protein
MMRRPAPARPGIAAGAAVRWPCAGWRSGIEAGRAGSAAQSCAGPLADRGRPALAARHPADERRTGGARRAGVRGRNRRRRPGPGALPSLRQRRAPPPVRGRARHRLYEAVPVTARRAPAPSARADLAALRARSRESRAVSSAQAARSRALCAASALLCARSRDLRAVSSAQLRPRVALSGPAGTR